jgi:hypothetical protein
MDNWKHRSSGMCCRTCMYFVAKERLMGSYKGGEPQQEFIPERRLFGRCRRRCPTMAGFPAVFGNDWCGDHKLDEEKI